MRHIPFFISYDVKEVKKENAMDYGPEPFAANIGCAAAKNKMFRNAYWTGDNLQMTLMSIPCGGTIGVEVHPKTDQVIRVEEGMGAVKMGTCQNRLNVQTRLGQGDAVFVPAGTWHNIINTGSKELKLSSIYAPPYHPRGTVHPTKMDAEQAEENNW